MEQKRKIDLHFILKQGRHLICFIAIVLLIFGFCFKNDAFAAGTVGSTENLLSYYQISDVSQVPILYKGAFVNYYTALGYSSSEVTWQNNSYKYYFFTNDTAPGSNVYSNARSLMSSTDLATSYTDGVTYDLSNAYTYISAYGVSNNNLRCCLRILSLNNSKICVVYDNNAAMYLVSASPFVIIEQVGSNIINVSETSANGLYCYYFNDISSAYNGFYCAFTDLDIYYPSSTGNSGFTNFSTSSTDLDLSAENVNFNIIKTGEYIVSPGDPEPEPEVETIGQYYTYCGIDAFFSSGNAESVLLNYTVSPNEYMRLHPSEYDVMIDISAVIVTTDTDHPNIPLTYSNSYIQGLETYINSASNPNLQIWFDDLLNVNSNDSLADALVGWWSAVTNADSQYYNTNGSVISFGGASASGGTRSLGGYSLNPNLKISDIVFQCSIRVEYNQTDPRQVSGVYRFQQGLISGTRTQLENTIATNFNVPESYNPQYPAPITDSQGNIVVSSGGTNLTVNPVAYNNLNAIVEYLYHIDAQEFLALAGNNQNAIQYALNTVSSSDSNGFFPVLMRTFDIIPDQIWGWIKTAVAVILGGAILGISYRMVRWR